MKRSILLLALAATGCGAHYAFIPVSPPSHVVPAYDRDAAYYSIPEQDPHGDLRVLSYGLETLTDDDADIATLHLRVMLEDTGPKPWTFDTREQAIAVDGFGVESPAFAVSDRTGDGSLPPVVNLTYGWTRIIDLFYPLPAGVDAMPAFRAITKVETDDGAVTETTPFERVAVSIFSPYMQPDVVAEGDYDYMDEPFWNNAGGVAFGGRSHGWRGRVRSRGHGLGGTSSSSSHRGVGGGGGRTRARPSVHQSMGGSGGGRHR